MKAILSQAEFLLQTAHTYTPGLRVNARQLLYNADGGSGEIRNQLRVNIESIPYRKSAKKPLETIDEKM